MHFNSAGVPLKAAPVEPFFANPAVSSGNDAEILWNAAVSGNTDAVFELHACTDFPQTCP
jgi:hypothetical protein